MATSQQVIKKLMINRLTIPFRPFYKRYPYTNKISINSADDRGAIDFELGFFCNRIPKAANSTVITNIAWLKTGEQLPPKEAKKIFLSPAQLSHAQMAEFDKLFKFTVARNPYTRTLSAYLEKVERRAARQGKQTTFRQFLYDVRDGLLYTNAHWAPQSDLLLIPIEQFDYVGKVETLNDDLAAINRRICPQREFPMTSAVKHATGANKKLVQYYDDELIGLVKTLYQRDFDVFGYSVDFPV